MRNLTWLMLAVLLANACAGPERRARLGGGRPLYASEGGVGWDGEPVERAEPEGPEMGGATRA